MKNHQPYAFEYTKQSIDLAAIGSKLTDIS